MPCCNGRRKVWIVNNYSSCSKACVKVKLPWRQPSTGCGICRSRILGFAKVDHHRALRHGMPEVIFGKGKTPDQVSAIAAALLANAQNVLMTRADPASCGAGCGALPWQRILPGFGCHPCLARPDHSRQGQDCRGRARGPAISLSRKKRRLRPKSWATRWRLSTTSAWRAFTG